MSSCPENADWDFVLQFVSEPLEIDIPNSPEKPVAERTNPVVPTQVPTPPVWLLLHTFVRMNVYIYLRILLQRLR